MARDSDSLDPAAKEAAMQWITVPTPPFGWIEQFNKLRAQLGERPAGLQARYVGSGDGKLRLVPLWESKEHADRHFAERLGPTLAKALGPEFIEIDVARSCVWEPVAWPTPGHTSRQAVSDPTVC
jgi:hypothetical protein